MKVGGRLAGAPVLHPDPTLDTSRCQRLLLPELQENLFVITIFQHGKTEPPGLIEELLHEARAGYRIVRLDEGEGIPRGRSSHLIFLGGQMSVNDEREYPYLSEEKELIRQSIKNSTPILGICLGAQLIASALGRRVYPSRPETGWCEVGLTGDGISPGLPDRFKVFQWHKETFDLPSGAALIGRGEAVENQIFSCGSALGTQFHMEVTMDIIREWSRDLEEHRRREILLESPQHLAGSERVCRALLGAFMRGE
jgi:GMP synthase (glutamine-hydrolysing)